MNNCHTVCSWSRNSVRSQGEVEEEQSIECRKKWLPAISRVGLTEELFNNGSVCSRHFVRGRPALYWEETNVDSLISYHTKENDRNNNRSIQSR